MDPDRPGDAEQLTAACTARGVDAVLRNLTMWAFEVEGGPDQGVAEPERRDEARRGHACAALSIRTRRVQSVFRLKDPSRRGACGISDMPLAVGPVVFVQLRRRRHHAAEVRWARNALVGLRFLGPLEPEPVRAASRVENSSQRRPIPR